MPIEECVVKLISVVHNCPTVIDPNSDVSGLMGFINLTSGCVTKRVVALMSTGTDHTMIDEDLAKELNLPILQAGIKRVLHAFGRSEMTTDLVSFELSPLGGSSAEKILVQAFTQKNLLKGVRVPNWENKAQKYPYLRRAEIPKHDAEDKYHMILGCNYANLYLNTSVRIHGDGPMAAKSTLGWTFAG